MQQIEKITLNQPITIDNILVHELRFRRPKVKDRLIVEKMAASDAEKEVVFIANLAGITKESIEELDLADYAKIQELMQSFLSQTQKN